MIRFPFFFSSQARRAIRVENCRLLFRVCNAADVNNRACTLRYLLIADPVRFSINCVTVFNKFLIIKIFIFPTPSSVLFSKRYADTTRVSVLLPQNQKIKKKKISYKFQFRLLIFIIFYNTYICKKKK